ncbi:AraC family transcriptional regulator [Vibrio atypicus]|uniref:AraC family transcriptional regulator n=1 Tax=Vibrio atypicus TaxID=558271 RepID=UPI003735B145
MADLEQAINSGKLSQQRQSSSAPLGQLKMQRVFYTHALLREPWGLKMPAIPSSTMFHLVLDGEAFVSVSGQQVQLMPGDFVLIPHGTGHEIVDTQHSTATDLFEHNLEQITDHYEKLTSNGQGALTTTICGTVLFESEVTASIIKSMPEYIVISTQSSNYPLLVNMIEAIQQETLDEQFATEFIVPKLADILILQCIRAWIARMQTSTTNWLLAYSDKRLASALDKIHTSPSDDIDIDTLARLSAMSRTRFIEYFKQVLGQTPKQYVIEWRLNLARERLQSGNEPIINVALDVGYKSEAAFSRAYKSRFGEPPSKTKRRFTLEEH